MTDDAIRAELMRMSSKMGDQFADLSSKIARLEAILSEHIRQQAERTNNRDRQLSAVDSRHEALEERVDAIAEWRTRMIASSAVVGSVVAIVGAPLATAISSMIKG